MEKINDLFDQEITKTVDAYPSIYTKDDVVSLLSKIRTVVLTEVSELKPTSAITEDRFQEFSESVTKSLENKINRGDIDVYDYSSAEFSINYPNTIEIENLDVNTDSLVDELATILQEQFVGYFGELKQE
jgi:hypothetical protein